MAENKKPAPRKIPVGKSVRKAESTKPKPSTPPPSEIIKEEQDVQPELNLPEQVKAKEEAEKVVNEIKPLIPKESSKLTPPKPLKIVKSPKTTPIQKPMESPKFEDRPPMVIDNPSNKLEITDPFINEHFTRKNDGFYDCDYCHKAYDPSFPNTLTVHAKVFHRDKTDPNYKPEDKGENQSSAEKVVEKIKNKVKRIRTATKKNIEKTDNTPEIKSTTDNIPTKTRVPKSDEKVEKVEGVPTPIPIPTITKVGDMEETPTQNKKPRKVRTADQMIEDLNAEGKPSKIASSNVIVGRMVTSLLTKQIKILTKISSNISKLVGGEKAKKDYSKEYTEKGIWAKILAALQGKETKEGEKKSGSYDGTFSTLTSNNPIARAAWEIGKWFAPGGAIFTAIAKLKGWLFPSAATKATKAAETAKEVFKDAKSKVVDAKITAKENKRLAELAKGTPEEEAALARSKASTEAAKEAERSAINAKKSVRETEQAIEDLKTKTKTPPMVEPKPTPVPETTPVPKPTPVPESTPVPKPTPVPETTPVPKPIPGIKGTARVVGELAKEETLLSRVGRIASKGLGVVKGVAKAAPWVMGAWDFMRGAQQEKDPNKEVAAGVGNVAATYGKMIDQAYINLSKMRMSDENIRGLFTGEKYIPNLVPPPLGAEEAARSGARSVTQTARDWLKSKEYTGGTPGEDPVKRVTTGEGHFDWNAIQPVTRPPETNIQSGFSAGSNVGTPSKPIGSTTPGVVKVPQSTPIQKKGKVEKVSKLKPNIDIKTFAETIAKNEGFYGTWVKGKFVKETRSNKNNNPGNIRALKGEPQDDEGYKIFKTLEEGWEALYNRINTAASKSEGLSLYEFFAGQRDESGKGLAIKGGYWGYAPKQDSNDPIVYAQNLAKKLRIDPNENLIKDENKQGQNLYIQSLLKEQEQEQIRLAKNKGSSAPTIVTAQNTNVQSTTIVSTPPSRNNEDTHERITRGSFTSN